MGGLVSIFNGSFEISPKIAQFVIAPLDADGKIDNREGWGAKVLQYWPDSVSTSKSANWQTKDIPGSPVPLLQWINGSGRQFSFSTVFSRDMSGEIGKDVEEDKFNVDIDAAIAWLESLSSNDYEDVGDVKNASVAPPILWIYMPGNKIGYNSVAEGSLNSAKYGGWSGPGGVYCVMTEISNERKNWFQDGVLRFTSVSLSFMESIQVGQGIYPYGRKAMMDLSKMYKRTPSK